MSEAVVKKFLFSKRTQSSYHSVVSNDDDEGKCRSNSWEFVNRIKKENFYECDVLSKKDSVEKTSISTYRRKRVQSCPDSMDLRKLSKSLELAIIQLKEICREGKVNYTIHDMILSKWGEQFIKETESTSSCNESTCSECFEEETNHRNKVFYNRNRMSTVVDEAERYPHISRFVWYEIWDVISA